MKQKLQILLSTAAIALASSAHATDAEVKSKIEHKKNGGYESSYTAERTKANGTAVSSETHVDVEVDSSGHVDKTVKVENKADAKGLMNAKKDKAESTVKEKSNGGYKQVDKKVHSDAAGTDSSTKVTTDVDVDSKGNIVAEETVKKTIDPKGLLNEKTSTSKTKVVNGAVVESTKKSD